MGELALAYDSDVSSSLSGFLWRCGLLFHSQIAEKIGTSRPGPAVLCFGKKAGWLKARHDDM